MTAFGSLRIALTEFQLPAQNSWDMRLLQDFFSSSEATGSLSTLHGKRFHALMSDLQGMQWEPAEQLGVGRVIIVCAEQSSTASV